MLSLRSLLILALFAGIYGSLYALGALWLEGWGRAWMAYFCLAAWNAHLWWRLCAGSIRRVMGTANRATNYLVKAHDHEYRMEGPWWTGGGYPEYHILSLGISGWKLGRIKLAAAFWLGMVALAGLGGGMGAAKVALLAPVLFAMGVNGGYLLVQLLEKGVASLEHFRPAQPPVPRLMPFILVILWLIQVAVPLARISHQNSPPACKLPSSAASWSVPFFPRVGKHASKKGLPLLASDGFCDASERIW